MEKKIIITCSEEQYQQMLDHFHKGGQLELGEETMHGFGFCIQGFAGMWWMEAESQAGRLDLGDITWEVV